MTWLVMLVLLQAFTSPVTDACLDIAVTDSCGDIFSMEVIEDACVRYTGGYLDYNGCTLEFTNSDRLYKQICIKPETLQLSCSTEVKYYRSFADDFFGAERKFTCGQISYDEWCDSSSSVFIKITSLSGSDKVTLKVSLEKETDSTISPGVMVAICFSSAIVLFMIVSCIIMRCHYQNARVSAGPTNDVTMHTSAEYNQSGLSGNQRSEIDGYQSYPTGTHALSETALRQTTHEGRIFQYFYAPPPYEAAMSSTYDEKV